MNHIAGISGRLFPRTYVADQLVSDARHLPAADDLVRIGRQLGRWWRMVEASCGPASGPRTLFDRVAMPLFGRLGFAARDVRLDGNGGRGVLETPAAAVVGLVLLPWSDRPPGIWRDLSSFAREVGSRWCFVLATPFLSLVEARGFAVRRSVEFLLPDVLDGPSFPRFLALAHAGAFDAWPPGARALSPGTSSSLSPKAEGAGNAAQSARPAMIDQLVSSAERGQTRVRIDLEAGVATAVNALAGVVAHRGGDGRVRCVTPDTHPSPKEQALTLVYRVLFLLFAESRGLTATGPTPCDRAYSVGTLCREALDERPRFDLWEGLAAVSRLSRWGVTLDHVTTTAFNGPLFAKAAVPALERRPGRRRASPQAAQAVRNALIALGSRPEASGRRLVEYRDLGVEELGAVYERLLDLPELQDEGSPGWGRVDSGSTHSRRRKETGTFYTPRPLAEFVVRRTLGPLVDGASADDILRLRVVDPAMGSGALLVAACRFLAHAYAGALIEEGRFASRDLDDHARATFRRLVAEHCLAGVDSNPVAVQLARLSMWLTSLARGKPLTFLDHRLRVGNSLVGAGPDEVRHVRQPGRNGADYPLFDSDAFDTAARLGAAPLRRLDEHPAETPRDVRVKEALWREVTSSRSALEPWRRAASLWCARWFWPPADERGAPSTVETRALIDAVLGRHRTLPTERLTARLTAAEAVARDYGFFHWPLEFPDIFYDSTGRPTGGFHAVLTNPPWEMVRRDGPSGSADHRRPLVRFVRDSGLFPCCDRGHLNLYQPFIDRAEALVRPGGRIGMVLPWGVAVDDGASQVRRRWLEEGTLDTLVGLDNAGAMFPIHRGLRFAVVVAESARRPTAVRARFGVTTADQLDALPARHEDTRLDGYPWSLPVARLRAVGGSTYRIPDLRRAADLTLLQHLTESFPALGSSGGWGARFGRELNATEAHRHMGASGLPVVEGKHVHPFQVRTRSSRHISRHKAVTLLPDGRFDRPRLAYRDISGVANSRSLIAAVLPPGVVTTHTLLCLRAPLLSDGQQHFLCALFNSFVLNSAVRLLMGGHVTTTLIEDLPVPVWTASPAQQEIAALAQAMTAAAAPEGVASPASTERRRPIVDGSHDFSQTTLATLEALVAHQYALDEPAFAGLLEGFPLIPTSLKNRSLEVFRSRASRPRSGGDGVQKL